MVMTAVLGLTPLKVRLEGALCRFDALKFGHT
jgi:hypothetical protein